MDVTDNFKSEVIKDKLGIGLFGLGCLFLLLTTYIGLTEIGMWYDEYFSMAIVNLPVDSMIELSMIDVHPILYYFIYKFFANILFFLDIGIVGKITSLIPVYLIGVLSYTKIRKQFNWLTAGLFFLCITTMPQLMLYAVEIRMYSWGLFFVTSSFIYAWDLIDNENNLKNWIILTIMTICSIYTHYFCAIASAGIYLIMLFHFIRNDYTKLKYWFISAIICILSYIPWINIVIKQFNNVRGSFWLDAIHFKTAVSYVYYTFSPSEILVKANELVEPTILGSILVIVLIYLIYKKRDKYAYYAIIAFLFVPIVGIILSKISTPCFHPRYMVPVLGCLWLGFTILLSKLYDDNIYVFGIILCTILLVGCIGTVNFINIEKQEVMDMQIEANSLNEVVGNGNIVISEYFPVYFELHDYEFINDDYFFYCTDTTQHISETLHNPEVKKNIDNGSKVYYLGINSNLLKDDGFELKEHNITLNTSTIKLKVFEIIP